MLSAKCLPFCLNGISKQKEGHKEMFLFQLFCKSQTEEIQQYLVYSSTAVPYTDFYHFLPLNNQ